MTQITAKSKTNVDIVLTEERTFAKALKFYTDDKIEFECADNTLNITCGGKKANQKLLDVKSFPKIPTVGSKTNNNFNYSNEKLKERFNTIKYAIAQNNARPALTGVYFNGTDMVGIDGCRIALNKDKALNISNAFIVPANAIKLANDVLNDNITITTDNKYIEFKDQYTTVTNRLLEGEYPKYNDFIGSKGKKIINVDVKEFINGLNYLKTFKSAKDKAIARWLGDKISDTNGTVDSKIKVDNPAALDIEIGFNADYMIEALSQFKDNVKIFVKNTVSPIIMTHPKNDIIAALFPVRIKN
jgi:DNA polymerase-3 subunit beta